MKNRSNVSLESRILKEVNGGMVAEEVRILEMSKLHCFSSSTPSISSWMGGAKEEELCNDGEVWEP